MRLSLEAAFQVTERHKISQPDKIIANKIALKCKIAYDLLIENILNEQPKFTDNQETFG